MLSLQRVASTPYERAWNGALKARMNSIYYEREIARVQRWDRWLRFISALIASGGVAVAVRYTDSPAIPVIVGVISACFSAASLVFTLPERAKAAAALLPQYVEAFHRLRDLVIKGEDIDEKELVEALKFMDMLAVVEAKEIRTNDRKLLKSAEKILMEELGAAPKAA